MFNKLEMIISLFTQYYFSKVSNDKAENRHQEYMVFHKKLNKYNRKKEDGFLFSFGFAWLTVLFCTTLYPINNNIFKISMITTATYLVTQLQYSQKLDQIAEQKDLYN